MWKAVYPKLAGDRPGLFGALTGRAEALVTRMSLVYALLDSSPVIRAEHLSAALAAWKYCEDSARYIFGDALGDPVADEIVMLLRRNPDGVTRTEISAHFKRNKKSSEITRALAVIAQMNLAFSETPRTGGRGGEVWIAC
jgi:hypothetical protein